MRIDLSNKIHRLVLCGLLAACILVLTIVLAVPIPNMTGAYVNLGDAGVYLAAAVLGGPWGALSAAVGSALADVMLGSALYAIPTFLIKGLMAFFAGLLLKRFSAGKRLIALAIAGSVMPVGYFLFETALYGAGPALIGVPANLVQYGVGILLGSPVIAIVEKFLGARA